MQCIRTVFLITRSSLAFDQHKSIRFNHQIVLKCDLFTQDAYSDHSWYRYLLIHYRKTTVLQALAGSNEKLNDDFFFKFVSPAQPNDRPLNIQYRSGCQGIME